MSLNRVTITGADDSAETPRTDALDKDLEHDTLAIFRQDGKLSDIVAHVTGNLFKHARQLERELTAEKERVKQSAEMRDEAVAEMTKALNKLTSATKRADEAEEKEQARWQQAIYDLCCKLTPKANIDGGGTDSGDPLDFTLSEIGQAINWWAEMVATYDHQSHLLKDYEGVDTANEVFELLINERNALQLRVTELEKDKERLDLRISCKVSRARLCDAIAALGYGDTIRTAINNAIGKAEL